MQKVGILGGTFDPVHIGHLIIAENAREQAGLDRVIFIPAYIPPHKTEIPVSAAEHRYRMVQLAIEDNPSLEVSDIELRRSEVSYSVETVERLKQINPEAEYYFVIGTDSLMELHTWREPEKLIQMCEFIVVDRPEHNFEQIKKSDLGLSKKAKQKLLKHVVLSNPVGISATDIRHRVAQGRSIKYLVPEEVEQYIKGHNLYQSNCNQEQEKNRS